MKQLQPPHLSEAQGGCEERTEVYLAYKAGVPQRTTQRFAKSSYGVGCWTAKQVAALWGVDG